MSNKTLNQLSTDLDDCKDEVTRELEQGAAKMNELSDQIKLLQEDVDELRKDVQQLIDIFRASRGFIKVMGWIGKAVKWLAGIGIAIGAIWAAFTHGGK